MLLCMHWQGRLFIDATLPFGLRSAPLIFSAIADALEWVVRQVGAQYIFHYINDFILLGPPGSEECMRGLRCLEQACENPGFVLATEKTEGPATMLTVLGIKFDRGDGGLPEDNLTRLRTTLADWHTRYHGSRGDLESLVGSCPPRTPLLAPPVRPGANPAVQK